MACARWRTVLRRWMHATTTTTFDKTQQTIKSTRATSNINDDTNITNTNRCTYVCMYMADSYRTYYASEGKNQQRQHARLDCQLDRQLLNARALRSARPSSSGSSRARIRCTSRESPSVLTTSSWRTSSHRYCITVYSWQQTSLLVGRKMLSN